MADFITNGASELPGVKSDERPAHVPVAQSEWAASDTNKLRQAALDLRSTLVNEITSRVNADIAIIESGQTPADVQNAPVVAVGSTMPRALDERFADVVNVKDFGAVGDGVTDDTWAIQSARAAGSLVFYPEGNYKAPTLDSTGFIVGPRFDLMVVGGAPGADANVWNAAVHRVGTTGVIGSTVQSRIADHTGPSDESIALAATAYTDDDSSTVDVFHDVVALDAKGAIATGTHGRVWAGVMQGWALAGTDGQVIVLELDGVNNGVAVNDLPSNTRVNSKVMLWFNTPGSQPMSAYVVDSVGGSGAYRGIVLRHILPGGDALNIPNNIPITGRSAANDADYQIIALDADDVVQIGNGAGATAVQTPKVAHLDGGTITPWVSADHTIVPVSSDRGDTSQTLNVGIDAQVQRWATALTQNRTITLSAAGALNGHTFRVVRTGLGAFTLDVGGLKTIPNATAAFVDVAYDGSSWVLTGYGTL